MHLNGSHMVWWVTSRPSAVLSTVPAHLPRKRAPRVRLSLALPSSTNELLDGLGAGRTAAGAVLVAAPALCLRLLGTDSATARRVTWLTRMMGVRDGAIGVGALVAARRGNPLPWVVAGAVSDAVDTLALGAAVKQGRLRGPVVRGIVPLSGGAAVIGAWSALRLRRG